MNEYKQETKNTNKWIFAFGHIQSDAWVNEIVCSMTRVELAGVCDDIYSSM